MIYRGSIYLSMDREGPYSESVDAIDERKKK
jgi:hypothetical protein